MFEGFQRPFARAKLYSQVIQHSEREGKVLVHLVLFILPKAEDYRGHWSGER